MEKIALITDSTSDLNENIIKMYNINVLPLKIIYDNEEYLDRINITPEEVYNRMPEEIPTTSLPSIEDINDLFIKLEEQGYTHAIAITISSNLSGTFNALKLISTEYKNIQTHVFDSCSISAGEGCIVEECAKLIKEGKPFSYIVNELPKIKEKSHVYFIVDTLEYLKKGGRIGKVSGTIGQLLKIKPIISIDENGVYYTIAKARGKKQVINTILSIVQGLLNKSKCKMYIMHGGAPEDCQNLINLVSDFKNIVSLETGSISPAAGVHTGPGLLGVGLFEQ